MAFTCFEDFCSSLCQLIGVETPPTDSAPAGSRTFAVVVGDARISFTQCVREGEPGVVMAVNMGKPPSDADSCVFCGLLDANFDLAGIDAPVFARNPLNGEICLCHSFLLSRADTQDIFQRLMRAAEVVTLWRESDALATPRRTQPHGGHAMRESVLV